MNDIINLKQFRKHKSRSEKERQADANRILFGRTKTEKLFAKNQADKSNAFLEQNRLEPRIGQPAPHTDNDTADDGSS